MMRRKILFIDDDESMLDMVAAVLERAGYTVETANEGLKGIDSAKNFGPDLILLDYRMPSLSGPETLARLKQDKELSGIPVIFLSGSDADNIALAETEAIGFLHKPFKVKEFMENLDRLWSANQNSRKAS